MGRQAFHHIGWGKKKKKLVLKSGGERSEAADAPMSSTSTSTSTSSKLAGKLTLSGGSMHPSQSTALSNPTDVVEQQATPSERLWPSRLGRHLALGQAPSQTRATPGPHLYSSISAL